MGDIAQVLPVGGRQSGAIIRSFIFGSPFFQASVPIIPGTMALLVIW